MSKHKFRDNLNVAHPLKRPKLHSSRLLHVLADLSLADTAGASVPFSEQLALWVDFTHAIKLSALLNVNTDGLVTPRAKGAPGALGQQVAQVRTSLENSITNGCTPKVFQAQIELHSPTLELAAHPPTSYEPYRRYHQSLQRDMENATRALRLQARDALGKASPALKKLAALDATFDNVLSEREGKLLAKMPLLLERRWGALQSGTSTDHSGDWLPQFRQDFQTMLLAELDLRLQTTIGLVEALQNDSLQHP